MYQHFLNHPFRLLISTFKAGCAAHLAFTHVVQVSAAGGPSMLPTFSVAGDWILADMTARRGAGIAIGDLVLYKIPYSEHLMAIKRLAGMPGDYVVMGTPGAAGDEQMIQVPEGHCWVVGDNLHASRDSRQFGPLPLALVQGRVMAKVLPLSDRKWFKNGLTAVEDS